MDRRSPSRPRGFVGVRDSGERPPKTMKFRLDERVLVLRSGGQEVAAVVIL